MKRKRRKLTIVFISILLMGMAGVSACADWEDAFGGEPVVIYSEAFDLSMEPEDTMVPTVESIAGSDVTETAGGFSTEEMSSPEISPTITIRMVGDILLHDRVSQYARQEDGTYQYDVIFDGLEEEIQGADLAIVNQEVIIAGEEFGVSGYPSFNAPFALGDALADAGFDVVCHGTNHALDKRKEGLLGCLQYWESSHPQMAVLGIHETAEDQDEIYIYEQDGIQIAVLNYTYGTNGIPLPEDMPFAVDMLNKDRVVADIQRAEMLADFTIVCPHWGTEYVLEETAEQKKWVDIFLENGVDLVLGTHPHVIEPIQMFVNEETGKEMLVYYSLGNFVNWTSSSGEGIANRMVGGMADVTLGLDDKEEVVIMDYSVTAVVTHLESRTNGVYTTKLSEYTQEQSLQNEITLQDPAFSKGYCEALCDKVWGELWR